MYVTYTSIHLFLRLSVYILYVISADIIDKSKEHTNDSRYIEEKADKLQKGDKKFQSLIACCVHYTLVASCLQYTLINRDLFWQAGTVHWSHCVYCCVQYRILVWTSCWIVQAVTVHWSLCVYCCVRYTLVASCWTVYHFDSLVQYTGHFVCTVVYSTLVTICWLLCTVHTDEPCIVLAARDSALVTMCVLLCRVHTDCILLNRVPLWQSRTVHWSLCVYCCVQYTSHYLLTVVYSTHWSSVHCSGSQGQCTGHYVCTAV